MSVGWVEFLYSWKGLPSHSCCFNWGHHCPFRQSRLWVRCHIKSWHVCGQSFLLPSSSSNWLSKWMLLLLLLLLLECPRLFLEYSFCSVGGCKRFEEQKEESPNEWWGTDTCWSRSSHLTLHSFCTHSSTDVVKHPNPGYKQGISRWWQFQHHSELVGYQTQWPQLLCELILGNC